MNEFGRPFDRPLEPTPPLPGQLRPPTADRPFVPPERAGRPPAVVQRPTAAQPGHDAVPLPQPVSSREAPEPLSAANKPDLPAEEPEPTHAARDEASPDEPSTADRHLGALAVPSSFEGEDDPAEPPEASSAGTGKEPPIDTTPPETGGVSDGDDGDRPGEGSVDMPEPAERIGIAGVEIVRAREPTDALIEAPELRPPAFLSSGAIQERLGVSPSSLLRMREELFTMVLGERSYRYPEEFVEAYRDWLDTDAGISSARQFAGTTEAAVAIVAVRADFKAALKRLIIPEPELGGSVVAADFARLVGVSETTVGDWRKAGLETHVPGWRMQRRIALPELRRFCSWQYPRSFFSTDPLD